MADLSTYVKIRVRYVVSLPDGFWRAFDTLGPSGYVDSGFGLPPSPESGVLIVPVDVITAARLGMISPGDSGLNEAQWAWIKLLGFTGAT